VLAGRLQARLVVVGADFHFGHNRGGNVALLEQMGADLGFEVLGLGLVAPQPGSVPFSSTRVRELLAAGDVEAAAEVLGRPHELRGALTGGELCVDERMCVPAAGRYAGTLTESDGPERRAVIAIGADASSDVTVVTGPLVEPQGPEARVRFGSRIGRAEAAVGT
jgi:riboflavin kinase/FMN adenylyltransferase